MNVNINPNKKDETVIQPESNVYDAIESCAEYGSMSIILLGFMYFGYKLIKLTSEKNKGEIKNEGM